MTKSKKPVQYKLFTTYNGTSLTVWPVPQLVLAGVKPERPKPPRPKLRMKLATGGTQERWAKGGDVEYDDWQIELGEWQEEKSKLEEAVAKVMALRSFEVKPGLTLVQAEATDLTFSEVTSLLFESGVIEKPDNKWLLKALWVDSELLTPQDDLELTWIVQELGGVPEDIIQQMKDSFRSSLLGTTTPTVGRTPEEDSAE